MLKILHAPRAIMERGATCGITTTRSGDGTLKLVERAYHVVYICRLVDYNNSTINTTVLCNEALLLLLFNATR